ncbi:MAG: SMC-Scp complex subunit ScpB [Deltaproteobacteria bacterium]|nr:SMC-Scp complex subunit ScpB [Deltaproteobacteria bacterium]
MDSHEIRHAIEAIVFASAEPVTLNTLKKIFLRLWCEETKEIQEELISELKSIYDILIAETNQSDDKRGFVLVQVADGLTYRSNTRYSYVLRAMCEEKPLRLSQAALETLAVIAYRQPVTKPEIDDIRGVDCGGTMRLLLERNLIRIVGKKDEPGRPMLYATTREFLSFFNLNNLAQLPSLREFHELNPESTEELRDFDEKHQSIEKLSQQAKKLGFDAGPDVELLDQAMSQLTTTEATTRDALASQGIQIEQETISNEIAVTNNNTDNKNAQN